VAELHELLDENNFVKVIGKLRDEPYSLGDKTEQARYSIAYHPLTVIDL
jgi:hypothetical protein